MNNITLATSGDGKAFKLIPSWMILMKAELRLHGTVRLWFSRSNETFKFLVKCEGNVNKEDIEDTILEYSPSSSTEIEFTDKRNALVLLPII